MERARSHSLTPWFAIRTSHLEKHVPEIHVTVNVTAQVDKMEHFQERPCYHPEDSRPFDRVRYLDPSKCHTVALQDNISPPILFEGIVHEVDERVPQDP